MADLNEDRQTCTTCGKSFSKYYTLDKRGRCIECNTNEMRAKNNARSKEWRRTHPNGARARAHNAYEIGKMRGKIGKPLLWPMPDPKTDQWTPAQLEMIGRLTALRDQDQEE